MGVSDEQLLRMLEQAGEVEGQVEHAFHDTSQDEADDAPEQEGDPCSHCGEPAEHVGDCHVCETPGCLPPDLWSPGMNEPCLTLCVRCARSIHWSCSGEDAVGNPACPTCKF